MNIEDLLGAVTQSGMRSRSSADRLRRPRGGGSSAQDSEVAQDLVLGWLKDIAGNAFKECVRSLLR